MVGFVDDANESPDICGHKSIKVGNTLVSINGNSVDDSSIQKSVHY